MMPSLASAAQIREALNEHGLLGKQIICLREAYALPAYDWVVWDFPVSYRQFRKEIVKITDYRENNLCLDYTADALWWASVLNRQTRSDAPLAIGRCFFTRINGRNHGINVAICREGQRLFPVWWEPQLPGEVSLSYEETCTANVEFS